jgi:hypothetical protein
MVAKCDTHGGKMRHSGGKMRHSWWQNATPGGKMRHRVAKCDTRVAKCDTGWQNATLSKKCVASRENLPRMIWQSEQPSPLQVVNSASSPSWMVFLCLLHSYPLIFLPLHSVQCLLTLFLAELELTCDMLSDISLLLYYLVINYKS